MKLALVILLFIICGIISGAANASDFITSDNPAWSREDMLIRKAVQGKWYSIGHPIRQSQELASIRPIDGQQPVVEISQARTGLPEEYLPMPTSKKDMERYNGH